MIKNNKTLKAVILTAIITTLIVGGIGVTAIKISASDIIFKSTSEGLTADNVEDAINELYQKEEYIESSILTRTEIGSGGDGTYDATVIPNYQELTADNFVFVPSTVSVYYNTWGHPDTYKKKYDTKYSSISLTYNPETGIVTLSGTNASMSLGESGGDAKVYGTIYCYN